MIDSRPNKPRFQLGDLVITPHAASRLTDDDVRSAIRRHASGDWGIVCDEDRQANDYAVTIHRRIISVYLAHDQTKFWIITEADRSVTTVLLPEDY